MIRLGKIQELVVVKKVEFGVYLAEPESGSLESERVLLPIKQVPEGTQEGTQLRVYIYKDSSDRLIATTREGMLQVEETALLTVAQVGSIGAFLSWGLEKDLLLPFREQTRRVQEGEKCLIALYIDKSDRLCATMKVYPYLRTQSPYGIGDTVTGRVYEISREFGVFVAVDDQYSGLIPRQEAQGQYTVGEQITLRVTQVLEDGKLNLSARQKAYMQISDDAVKVLEVLEAYQGVLPFDDKASPDIIAAEFEMSKNAFKRAVGHLLKEKKVEIKDGRIYTKAQE
ncbi:MAG: S1 RNA-binding domain-containing protein [Lachnospiraceae bacterium]